MTNKFQKVIFKDVAQEEMLRGAEKLAEAVSSTMGPSGHSVIIDNEVSSPTITKDGVTVAKSICLKDKLHSIGAELLKEIAGKTNELAGDGTTTATVLGYSLLKEGHKLAATGVSSLALKRGMDKATELVQDFLQEKKIPVSNREDIINVGTISANGDREIGALIAEAIEKVGADGLIAVEPSKTVRTTLNIAEGIQIQGGFVSPFFITNNDKQICELENPYVLVTANKINSMQDIVPVLEQIDRVNKPLLIVADEVEGDALHTLVVNKTKQVIQVCAVRAPSYGEHRADLLEDLAVVVNGSVIGATSEISLQNVKLDQLGRCKRAVVDRRNTTFLVNNENNEASERIQKRASELKNALNEDPTMDDRRVAKFRERLARLSGGIAVIQVGGSTEVEIKEKKDRVEDAVNATQAAAQEGIVPGGGTALFYAAQHLKQLQKSGLCLIEDDEELNGYNLIVNTCEAPLRTIIRNTGIEPAIVENKLKQNWAEKQVFYLDVSNLDGLTVEAVKDYIRDVKNTYENTPQGDTSKKFRYGYDAYSHQYTDLIESGIIDPVKVTRYALEHSVSVIGLMLTCDAVVLNEDVETD